ncbi:MAG: WecB/TagA/CpsF family glycosyltransferase, partial [Prevotella sp.]|nr:WecB/TagA/CpsF family glycosyltransferase [Prevotella sp.]
MNTTRILNCDIMAITQEELLHKLNKGVLITPNVDHIVKLQRDKEFYDTYREATWVVCDSKILCLLSRLLKFPLPEAIPGSSFFTSYYNYHKNDPECRIFLLGAAEGIARMAMELINERTGRRIVVGAHSPSYGFEKNEAECKELVRIV